MRLRGPEPHAQLRARPWNCPHTKNNEHLAQTPRFRRRAENLEASCLGSISRFNTSLILCAMWRLCRVTRAPVGSQVRVAASLREWKRLATTALFGFAYPKSRRRSPRKPANHTVLREQHSSSRQGSALDVDPSCQRQARLRTKMVSMCHSLARTVASHTHGGSPSVVACQWAAAVQYCQQQLER